LSSNRGDAGIVDEHVNPPKTILRRLEQAVAILRGANISLKGKGLNIMTRFGGCPMAISGRLLSSFLIAGVVDNEIMT